MTITEIYRVCTGASVMLLLGMSALCGQSVIAAEKFSTADSSEFTAVAIPINSEHLIELYQSVPDLRIIDSRYREDHALGHIERSHSLPLPDTDCDSLSRLAANTDQALVFYCNGGSSVNSTEAIRIASGCGYKRLFWLEGGFIEWKDNDYPFVIE
jgi:rhodanese-related sulfurtransferase